MKKYLLFGLIALMLSVGLVLALKPDTTPKLVNVEPSQGRATVVIPANAVEVAPGVFSLGLAVDKGRLVEGYAIVDYKKAYGKPSGCNNDGKCQGWEDASCGDCAGVNTDTGNCYGFLAKGAKWKVVEPYIVNPWNTRSLGNDFVVSNLGMDVEKWEVAAGTNIIGVGLEVNDTLVADMVSPDDRNEVYFGDVGQSGAIAVTVVWGIFRGPIGIRELVEWDQVYDHVDFDWSAAGEAGKMDFESIATHELGHSVGLSDLYETRCMEQTMYGYADYGETKKRTLEAGDVNGVMALY